MSLNSGYVFSKDTASLFAVINGEARTAEVKRSSVEFDEIAECLHRAESAFQSGDTKNYNLALEDAFAAFDKAESIRRQSEGKFQVVNGVVMRDGAPVHNAITTRVIDFVNEKLPFASLLVFMENLNENPSKRSVDELYGFLELGNMPITPDGCFLAYKSISEDWLSKASGSEPVEVSTDGGKTFKVVVGRIPNHVGTIVRMKRNLVDDNANRTCSKGLHVGALKYAGPGGWYNDSNDHVVIVKVNPRAAVSVPTDHSCQKLRVCEYEVVAEFQSVMEQPLFKTDATPLNAKTAPRDVVPFRCKECRRRKKASTFVAKKGRRHKCPKCGSKRTFRIK